MKEELRRNGATGNHSSSMERIISSYGQNQKNNGRIIDSDEDIDTLNDGTLLNNGKKSDQAADNWLKTKSELITCLHQLLESLTGTPTTISNSQFMGL